MGQGAAFFEKSLAHRMSLRKRGKSVFVKENGTRFNRLKRIARTSHLSRRLALIAVEVVKDAELKIYEGGGHGFAQLQAAQFNTDVPEIIRR